MQALHPPVGWALASLAGIRPGHLVLDPMVGRAGLLIQAARLSPAATFFVTPPCRYAAVIVVLALLLCCSPPPALPP